MATRFYLGATAADYTPATKRGAWDDASATLARRLAPAPEGAASTATTAETAAAAGHDVLLGRWISDPALTAGTLSGTATWIMGVLESATAADLHFHLHAYVTTGDSDTPRGTLLADSIGATEWPTAATGRGEGAKALASVAVSAGDRLVVEIGYAAQNAVATSYSGTLHYGNTGATDLAAAASTVTTDPGWIEFSGADALFYPPVSTLTDTFSGVSLAPVWDGSYGGVSVVAGRGRVECAQIGGTPQYAAIYATPSVQSRRWHLADSAIFCEAPVVPAANGGGGAVYSHFAVTAAVTVPGSYAGCFYNAVANVLVLQSTTGYSDGGATYLPYDATAHRWWRIRHAAGVLYWDTSPDSVTWTNRRTQNPAPSWTNHSALGVLLEATRDSGTADYAEFDNVNTPTLVVHDATAALTAASTLTATGTRATGATSALTAASTLTAAAVRVTAASSAMTAASALSAAAVRATAAAAAFTAPSALTATAVTASGASAALTGDSSLTATATRTTAAAAAFTATSSLTGAAVPTTTAVATLSAASTLEALADATGGASAALSAASALSAAGITARTASAAFSAGSALTALAVIPGQPTGVSASPASITVIRGRATLSAVRGTATLRRG
jgi:hypothetical protein